ncbi:MAG: UDP-N-acetylglucosamine--N-acetylmuramyl-(pentapeptide) pyrophosphoryl-undecaprenol N-acetylglucosamine transferase [Rickettsiales bacterium]|nr:UDP-N-acetylglucosamine--N-acetylmuramyl-(pentapeptide) pyrophosphoryl-undecaprenol N-acetylglucosamine transferase [Rickettsiales bacterium]
MTGKRKGFIWIATGGTAGHIFPALAVADELMSRGYNVTVSTDARGKKHISPITYRVSRVWASGVGAKNVIFQITSLFKIGISTVALLIGFIFQRPAKIVAFGGYSSVPVLIAGRIWRVPTFLHEQNAVIGRANKFAMPFVKTLMTSFPLEYGAYTGLPVRKEILKARPNPMPKPEPRLLVMGGSLGASILDRVVPDAVSLLKKKLFVVHQTRPENIEKTRKIYAKLGVKNNVLSFIRDVATELSEASLVICRGGAATLAELRAVGVPALIVPLNINPDQLANAKAFSKNGGGIVIEQTALDADMLAKTLSGLLWNPERLKQMADLAYAPNDAAKRIADTVLGNHNVNLS